MTRFSTLACGLICALALGWAGAASAQQLLAEYTTYLSPRDRYNSQGVALTTVGAILQQDRANYHRFGRRDDLDMYDPYFGSAEVRAQIPAYFQQGPGIDRNLANWIFGPDGAYVFVRIWGNFGRIAFIEVAFAAD
jgi:hypothetical protein